MKEAASSVPSQAIRLATSVVAPAAWLRLFESDLKHNEKIQTKVQGKIGTDLLTVCPILTEQTLFNHILYSMVMEHEPLSLSFSHVTTHASHSF